MVNLTINNKAVSVPEGTTILEAAGLNNIRIPHLCYLKGVHRIGSCRICVVEVEGARGLQASCMVTVREGMVVHTHSERVRTARQNLYELMLSDHPKDCLKCERNQKCELQSLGEILQSGEARFEGEQFRNDFDHSSPSIIRDTSKCILCRRCVTVCNEIQGIGVLNAQNRGFKTVIGTADSLDLASVNCTYCGQCVSACPVGALQEKDATGRVWEALADSNKRVIVQTAPAIRAALGEEFGFEAGTLVTGKLVSALRELGFDDVFDTNFAADLTIMEEGSEFLERVEKLTAGKEVALPMITSCSPGWVKYVEHTFPKKLEHLSSCKSPHMMLGAMAKSYYAEKKELDPKDIFVVSVMPCTAKKFEANRAELNVNGYPDVDAVITTRELARMIRKAGIDFKSLGEDVFDNPLGLSSGAGDIFAVTGGVMEAALRTVYEVITGRELPFAHLHVTPIVGLEQVKTAELTIDKPLEKYKALDGITIKVAVTSGFKGARILMDQVARGESPYHFIEIMGCPGGCISGGGQPRPTTQEVRMKRLQAIYRSDEGKALRKSHENPFIKEIYAEYLGEPLGEKSHHLLHTHYVERGKFNELLR